VKQDDLYGKPTQSALARISGITEARVGQLHAAGVFHGETLVDWLRCLCRRLGDEAGGRAGELADERARLAAAQADRVEMENAVTRQELAPRAAMEAAIADGARQAVAILEGVPAQVKRASAGVKARELAIVKREIDKARAAIAAIRLAT
jgi:phage terminase Nu1 subunit (DNA packaging protein)